MIREDSSSGFGLVIVRTSIAQPGHRGGDFVGACGIILIFRLQNK